MNAVKIMLFLLIFNVTLSIVSGLHIYNMQMEGEYSSEDIDSYSGQSALFVFVSGATFYSIVMGAVGGAIIGYVGGKIPTSEGIAYGIFGGTILAVFIAASSILGGIINIVPPYAQAGVALVIGLFLGISGLLFIIGYIQLIRGGIKSYM